METEEVASEEEEVENLIDQKTLFPNLMTKPRRKPTGQEKMESHLLAITVVRFTITSTNVQTVKKM